MASYLRPRRGKRSTAISSDLVLKRGEVFFEVPDSGVGTGAGKIVMGDGSSLYGDLPYFSGIDLNGTDAIINFTDTITETDISNNNLYLANINPTNALKNIFTNLKQLVFNFGAEIGRFNNNLTANRLPFRFGYDPESQQYGYILPDGEGGADTVHPFSSSSIKIPFDLKLMDSDISLSGNNKSTGFSVSKIPLDLSKASSIKITVRNTVSQQATIYLAISKEKLSSAQEILNLTDKIQILLGSGSKTSTLNVSNKYGEYYICITTAYKTTGSYKTYFDEIIIN